ncbi:MAG: leucine-rich repeat domain-containing protein, partial [Clostridiales bacterium]|nr:leucine-rich repeat domain-containing protein [Clostridiales bacterium]
SNTQIGTLPDSIGNLSNLQVFYISNTQIGTLPDSIGNLSNLQVLYISNTQINALPEFIGSLSNLQRLDLHSTQISTLPDSIGNLTNLQALSLSFTQINTLPEFIGSLTNLQELDLSYTHINTLPDSFDNLTNLKRLYLNELRLQQIPRSLFELGLVFFFDECPSSGIDLSGTTLATQPISLFHQPPELIHAYYSSPKDTINDAKVIFLGDGGVGKSRTIKRLLNGGEPADYPTEMTPGIDISSYRTTYNGHPVDLRIWDFGGQEIMHAMHRCFLTGRTCYVVMVSNRAGNRTQRARYWLKTIESFAPNCPVILAVNLWDTDKGTDGINNELLAQEFPNVITQEPIVYSAKGSDKEHFNRLTEAIVEQASRLDSCGMEFPKSWANIRAALLEKQAKETPYISKADYLRLCEDSGETDQQICGWLLEWFNDLGVCFSYHTDKTSGQELENYQVLSPKWLFDAVYRLINQGGDFAQRGVLPRKGIESILKDYLTGHGESASNTERKATPDYTYILEVMRKFRLSYPVNKESEFIPALCLEKWEKAPQTAGWDSHVTYEMQYEYLPDTVLHRLMIFCKANHLLEQAWNGGMELSHDFDRLHAAIYLREESSTLEINAYAKDGRKSWALLEILRSELRAINTDLNLEAEDVFVMRKNQQTAHFPVSAVLKAVDRNISALYSVDGGELEEYQVNEILGAAFDMEKVEKEKKKAEEEKRPMSEKYILDFSNAQNVNLALNSTVTDSFSINHFNDQASEEAENLLQQVLAHQERVTEQFMDKLLEVLRESREQSVQKLVAEVDTAPQKKKSRLEVVRDLLSDGSNLATVAGAIGPHLPTLLALAKGFLPGL